MLQSILAPFKRYAPVSALLALSIYLILTAVVAVPLFQDRDNTVIAPGDGKAFEAMLDDTVNVARFANLKIDSFKPSAYTADVLVNSFNRLNADILTYNNYLYQAQQLLYDQKKLALTNFLIFDQTKPTDKEKGQYELLLVGWYQGQERIVDKLNGLKATINDYFQDRRIALDGIQDGLKNDPPADTRALLAHTDSAYAHVNLFFNQLADAILQFHAGSPLPEQPYFGQEFHAASKYFSWMLTTESTALALVAGLFGFGLLGAIGSNFIRQKVTTAATGAQLAYSSNLLNVLMAGLSSALVVFLAVKGSIVILGAKDNNVNPYLLFFLCLVAAVYNEEIWKWAKDKLFSTLSSQPAPTGTLAQPTLKPNSITNFMAKINLSGQFYNNASTPSASILWYQNGNPVTDNPPAAVVNGNPFHTNANAFIDPVTLPPGTYDLYIVGATDGQLVLSIGGTGFTLDHQPPASYNGGFRDMYVVTVNQ